MEFFVQTTVFNPQLVGKAVHLKGFDRDGEQWDGVYLVNSTDGTKIKLIDNIGITVTLHMENFTFEDNDLLKITVMEAI